MGDAQYTESIKDLVTHLDDRRVALPEFQRDFVWELPKTLDLFDSIVRDIFIGSIIYGIPSFEVTTRAIDDRPRKGKGSRRKLELKHYSSDDISRLVQTSQFRLILDGQQRTTSIYRALKGIDTVYFVARPTRELLALNPSSFALEDTLSEFAAVESVSSLCIRLKDVYDMLEGNVRREKEKQDILQASAYFTAMRPDEKAREALFEWFLAITERLQDLFKADKLVSYYLLDTSIEKFSLFFERSNSKAIRLDFIDILAAKLYSGFNLRRKIEEAEDASGVPLNRELVVRAISHAVSGGKEIDRAYILKELTARHFEEHWNEVVQLYVKCLAFLRENKLILSLEYMPYEAMLVPMMVFLKNLPSQDFSQASADQMRFLKWWYWGSIFSERYTSGTITIMIDDCNALADVARRQRNLDDHYSRRFQPAVQDADDLLHLRAPGSAVYKGVLTLIAHCSGGLVDWGNGAKVPLDSKVDSHHIFAKEYLGKDYRGTDEGEEYVDCVANRALIPKITNIKIGKKPPSAYLGELSRTNPNLSRCLQDHLIDPLVVDGRFDSAFLDFLRLRSERMRQAVAEVTSTVAEAAMKPFRKG